MRKIAFAVIAAALMLTACGREDQWQTATGSPQAELQPAVYRPSSSAPHGALRGCLNGSNESFTLVEESTASVYRLRANEDPEAVPNAREVYDDLRLNSGRMVEITGQPAKEEDGPPVPWFQVERINALAGSCPANLRGAVNEFNRPPTTGLESTHAGSVGAIRGSMQLTRPPVSIMPVNPAR